MFQVHDVLVGGVEWRNGDSVFVAKSQGLARGHQDVDPRTAFQDANDELAYLCHQMLTVVQDQEEPGRAKESHDSLAA